MAIDERGAEARTIDAHVLFSWRDAGPIGLDDQRMLRFPEVPRSPGLYRMTLTGAPNQIRPRVYVGEAQSLVKRMGGYRSPGGRNSDRPQTTNIRLNDELRALLAAGGAGNLAIVTAVNVTVAGAQSRPLDLSGKWARVFAEHAALVAAQLGGEADVINA